MSYKNKSFMTKRKAFTLIELLIVIAIIGILFIVLVSKVDFATDKAKATGVQTDFRSFQMAFDTVAKENAGFNTFGWDTGDANQDGIHNSYDEGDNGAGGGIAKNGIQDGTEVFTGHKVYAETFTKVYSLKKAKSDGTLETNYDRDALNRLETAINANLDPKLHITIKDDGEIVMANGAQDPWNKEYHGYYITNAENDKKDRGAIVMYSDGANNEFGSKHTIANGIVSISIPNNNKYGKDDYGMAVIYTYINGYGEVKNITTGFSNNQQFLTGNDENVNSDESDDNVVTPQEPENSTGLEFSLNDDGQSYSVIGLGTCTDIDIVIPGTYEGLPVTRVKSKSIWDEEMGEYIYKGVFEDCDNIISITIPDSILSIDVGAFYYCSNLTSVTIGNSVTNVGDYAFYKCSSLTSVTIGNSVTSIGERAFCNCDSLTSITIPDSVTDIGNYAFYGCSSLMNVIIGDGVTRIRSNAFCNTGYYKNESNWENGVLYIGKYLIESKKNITGAYTVKSETNVIADSAFESCENLTSVTIPYSVTSIGDWAFGYCGSLTSVIIPDGVKIIGDRAFYDCYSLTSVTIPDSVTNMCEDVFYGCDSLKYNEYNNGKYLGNSDNPYIVLVNVIDRSATSFTISNTTKFIHTYAFEGYRSLTSITIPDGVTSIDSYVFSGCSSLTSVTIGSGVTSISYEAFNACSSLRAITIPNSVTSISKWAFRACGQLTDIYINNSENSIEGAPWNAYNATVHWNSTGPEG